MSTEMGMGGDVTGFNGGHTALFGSTKTLGGAHMSGGRGRRSRSRRSNRYLNMNMMNSNVMRADLTRKLGFKKLNRLTNFNRFVSKNSLRKMKKSMSRRRGCGTRKFRTLVSSRKLREPNFAAAMRHKHFNPYKRSGSRSRRSPFFYLRGGNEMGAEGQQQQELQQMQMQPTQPEQSGGLTEQAAVAAQLAGAVEPGEKTGETGIQLTGGSGRGRRRSYGRNKGCGCSTSCKCRRNRTRTCTCRGRCTCGNKVRCMGNMRRMHMRGGYAQYMNNQPVSMGQSYGGVQLSSANSAMANPVPFTAYSHCGM